jgi:glycosyltransferase involved in cell wall biosynthesis
MIKPHPDGKMRVLLIAELCNPLWSSVPLEAYSLAKALSARDDLEITLVSQVRSRTALESDPIAGQVQFEFIDNEFVGRPLYRVSEWLRGGNQLSWTTSMAFSWPAYMVFEQMVYRRFHDALRSRAFDLIHRISPISPTLGSPLARLTDVPMVVGPLNGGLPWPADYPELTKKEREWLVPLRGLYRWLPYHRTMYRHARGIIAGSRHTATEVPAWCRARRYYVPENGVDPDRIPIGASWKEPKRGDRFRFVTVGRLVPYKGTDLILQAMALSEELRREAELIVIGEGPWRVTLESQASELGLSSNVTFTGWIEHTKLADQLRGCQTFVFPSLREFGGAVVLEAMASGLPPIVVNYGGPGELVSDACGIRLSMAPRERLVGELSQAMTGLLQNPDQCRRLSAAAIDRVRSEFTWSRKAEQIHEIYCDILDISDTPEDVRANRALVSQQESPSTSGS